MHSIEEWCYVWRNIKKKSDDKWYSPNRMKWGISYICIFQSLLFSKKAFPMKESLGTNLRNESAWCKLFFFQIKQKSVNAFSPSIHWVIYNSLRNYKISLYPPPLFKIDKYPLMVLKIRSEAKSDLLLVPSFWQVFSQFSWFLFGFRHFFLD